MSAAAPQPWSIDVNKLKASVKEFAETNLILMPESVQISAALLCVESLKVVPQPFGFTHLLIRLQRQKPCDLTVQSCGK